MILSSSRRLTVPIVVFALGYFGAGSAAAIDLPSARKLNPLPTAKKVSEKLNPLPTAKKVSEKLNPVSAAKKASEKLSNLRSPDKPIEPVRDKWAVFVGMERYHDNSIPGMKQAEQTSAFASELFANENFGRFGPGHVVIVTNNKATKENITKLLGEQWLLKHALPNDLVVLFFNCRYKAQKDGSDLLLYMYDAPSIEPELGSIKLKETLAAIRMRSQSSRILCILDGSPAESHSAFSDDLLETIAKSTNATILSASKLGEDSNFSSTFGTSYLIANLAEGMKAGQGNLEFGTVFDYVKNTLKEQVKKDLGKEQVPVLVTPPDNQVILKTALGAEVKSSKPEKPIKIGHPPERDPDKKPKTQTVSLPDTGAIEVKKPSPKNEKVEQVAMGSVDFSSYMTKMKRDIQAKWVPPKGFDQRKVVAVFSIRKDGQIVDPEIVDGSGVQAVDQSALEALKLASPLDPLPEGAPYYVQIRYQFDWKVSKN
ncbi:MAG: TonB family protein [Cyanobacteria bacterium]|nr:TonB family protein [Cyanobacteriota bacterium]